MTLESLKTLAISQDVRKLKALFSNFWHLQMLSGTVSHLNNYYSLASLV